jgi:restriction endonuclease
MKKAQAGETITWVIATIIILIIVVVSVFVVGASDKARDVLGIDKKANYNNYPDRVVEKSFYSYLLTDVEGEKVYDKFKEEGVFSPDEKAELAKKIFKEYEGESDHLQIWMGVNNENNNVFGEFPSSATKIGWPSTNSYEPVFLIRVKLGENKFLNIVHTDVEDDG